ncbi:MAG: hypothetical protein LBE02_02010 [Spirochaetaceae bacterium]|nr:hypothetical protein [Spirochaetaceae bacterium]
MAAFLQALLLTLGGMVLLWLGFTLFFALPGGLSMPVARRKHRKKQAAGESFPGAPRTCPVCSARLERGERVKSSVFPSMGGADRFMHIAGCVYCLEGGRRRVCPVCGAVLRTDDFLLARLFEKPRRSHVHVFGCTRCKMRRK